MKVTLRCIDFKFHPGTITFVCCCKDTEKGKKKSKKEDDENSSSEENNEDELNEEIDLENGSQGDDDEEGEEEEEGEEGIAEDMKGFIVSDEEGQEDPNALPEVLNQIRQKRIKTEDLPECPLPNQVYTFLLEENPKFMKTMTSPVLEWQCEIVLVRQNPFHYVLEAVYNVEPWKNKELITFSQLCQLGFKHYTSKGYIGSFKSCLAKQEIGLKTVISLDLANKMGEGFAPLLSLVNKDPKVVMDYINVSWFIFLGFNDFYENKDTLGLLSEENLKIADNTNELFWLILKKGEPELCFSENNPDLHLAWEIYKSLTKEQGSKTKVKEEEDSKWSSGLLKILKSDEQTFFLKKVMGLHEVYLASRESKKSNLIKILKNINLTIYVNRVEDDFSDVYIDELFNLSQDKAGLFILAPSGDRAHYLKTTSGVQEALVKHKPSDIPTKCRILCIDKVHLYVLEEILYLLEPLKSLRELRIYGSLFSPYFEADGVSLVNSFAFLQSRNRQLGNVNYFSMAPHLSSKARKETYIQQLSSLKVQFRQNPTKRFIIFHSKREQKFALDVKTVTQMTHFEWFEAEKMNKNSFWKAVVNLDISSMRVEQFVHLVNEAKTNFIVFGKETDYDYLNKQLLAAAPRFDVFVGAMEN